MARADLLIASGEIPAESGVARFYGSTNLADSYSIQLPTGTIEDPELLARFIFAQPSPLTAVLMRIRDVLVAGFGLKTSTKLHKIGASSRVKRIGFFKIYGQSEREIILGEDDKHLDFRISVLCPAPAIRMGERQLVVSTVVHCHNRLGRIYVFIIAPFHRMLVQSSLRRAARANWPRACAT